MKLAQYNIDIDLDNRFNKPIEELSSQLSNFVLHPKIDNQVKSGSYNAVASNAVYNEISSLLNQISELRDLINLYHQDAKWDVDNIDALDECASQVVEVVTSR